MHFPRAGLFALMFTLFTALASAAPLAHRTSSHNLASESSQKLVGHPSSHALSSSTAQSQRNVISKTPQLMALSSGDAVIPREIVDLVRRKSIAAKIRQGFKKLGRGIKRAAQKVGHGIKTAAKKVGHFIKTTGAKIIKVGLKIMATAGKIAGKVAGFIPGIGKAVGKAFEAVSTVRDKISNAIHVNIGGKLGKAMHRMDKAQKVVGYIPRDLQPELEPRKRALNLGRD